MTGKIITVSQQKGGSGKTTLAAHLAIAFTRPDAPVAVLDVDPQGSLGQWFEMREQTLGEAKTGLVFRTASGWGARREARSLARDYQLVVIDTPPKSDLETRPAIEAADLVAVPIQPTHIDLWAVDPTLAMIAKEGSRSILVANRVVRRAALTAQVLAEVGRLGHLVAEAQLGNRVAFPASMGQGRAVGETLPGSTGALEVEALASEVARHIGR